MTTLAEEVRLLDTKEYIQFLYIALGSAAELETQLIIGNRIGYFEKIENEQTDLVVIKKMIKMINRLISVLKRKEI